MQGRLRFIWKLQISDQILMKSFLLLAILIGAFRGYANELRCVIEGMDSALHPLNKDDLYLKSVLRTEHYLEKTDKNGARLFVSPYGLIAAQNNEGQLYIVQDQRRAMINCCSQDPEGNLSFRPLYIRQYQRAVTE